VGSRRDEAPAQALRGTAGTSVRLSVLRPGEAQPRDYPLVRRRIAAGSGDARLLEPGYGYLRIRYFEGDTADETRRAIERLVREAGGPLAGLVLDLRNNPGGLLTTAVATADLFLEEGPIVSTRGRTPVANTLYRATPGDLLGGAPMAVLLDVGTASSAEVVAGALRDQRRALLLGARSFGKGPVQTVVDLGNGDAVKLTTARYYTPAGVPSRPWASPPTCACPAPRCAACASRTCRATCRARARWPTATPPAPSSKASRRWPRPCAG
jgi:carboxyl-terminal processing protease